ncbi:MAG: hypothetical protein JST73_00240 [Actinobacteria bacterium]|nr:hypothetical protein [Actinomycetota bacterium]
MRSDTAHPRLSTILDDPGSLDEAVEAHVANCLRCQADVVRYRHLGRAFVDLRDRFGADDDQLLDRILTTLDASEHARRVARRVRRIIYMVAAAGAAAGATGAAVAVGHARTRRPAG